MKCSSPLEKNVATSAFTVDLTMHITAQISTDYVAMANIAMSSTICLNQYWIRRLNSPRYVLYSSLEERNTVLHIYIYIIHTYMRICWFDFDALTQRNAYNPQRNREIIMDQAGMEFTASRVRQHQQLPVV